MEQQSTGVLLLLVTTFGFGCLADGGHRCPCAEYHRQRRFPRLPGKINAILNDYYSSNLTCHNELKLLPALSPERTTITFQKSCMNYEDAWE